MIIHFLNGPVSGELLIDRVKVGQIVTVTVGDNPNLYGKSGQQAKIRSHPYLIGHGGKAVHIEPKTHKP